MVQPSSIDVRLDRFFRVFENHRYPHIDPAVEQAELTRLVEPDGDEPFILHPGEFVLASTYEVITLPDDLAARLEGKSSLGRLGPRHALHRRVHRPRVLRARHAGALQRRDAADQAVAGDEDRAAVSVPAQLVRRGAVRVRAVRVALPGPAGPDRLAVLPQLPSDPGVSMNDQNDVRENLTYEKFGGAIRELAQTIADDGYEPDIVVSIARGGVFVAGGLAYALDCKNIHLVNVEFYTGVGTTLEMPVMLAPVPNAIDFSGKKVLITDDVADTGKTLKLVHDFCLDHVAEVRSAVIYEKSHSLVKCEYVWKRTDEWINFPWSVEPPVVRREGQVLDA